jgi:hypothetical protein
VAFAATGSDRFAEHVAKDVRGSPHFFVGSRDWFCPTLRIHHEGTRFDISIDSQALDAFYAAALG